jgi:hypothetical protein
VKIPYAQVDSALEDFRTIEFSRRIARIEVRALQLGDD